MFDTTLTTDTDLLGAARERRRTADRAEVDILELACEWGYAHPATDLEDVARCVIPGGDRPWAIAGEGCPEVAEFAISEFATALGLGLEGGKRLIGEALELRHRLPRLWQRIQDGHVQPWRGRKVAAATIPLSPQAADFVDRHLAPVAHSCPGWQIDRLVDDAIARHMPELAEEKRRDALDRRHVTIETNQISFNGTCFLEGELDLVDAQDLEQALRRGADALKAGGSDESLDARRSIALGDLARGQRPLDLSEVEVRAQRATKPRHDRRVVLHLHLAEAAVTGWVEEGRQPVTAEMIQQWCGNSGATVVVKPVIDLNQVQTSNSYEVPDRVREQLILRDRTCVFPYCHRPARGCDADHIDPYDPAGPPGQTNTDNLACLCRHHHRLRTHTGWTYTQLEPGVFLWRSPSGLRFLRDQTGTTDLGATDPPPRD